MASEGTDPTPSESEDTSDATLPEVSLSLDTLFSLLAHSRRRALLLYLTDTPDRTYRFDECVEHLITRGPERTGERPQQERVAATLHHTHVPKLRDAGVLEYNPRTEEIHYWGHDNLDAWLARIQAHEPDL